MNSQGFGLDFVTAPNLEFPDIDFRRCLMINHTKLRYDFAVGKTVFVCVYQYTTKLRLKRSPTTVLERTLS